ncbi:MAG: alpha/beta hydrolase [Blastocatellia bacterium]|nr:alpha/beta hydrolase [Blastocatellia bacterium]
MQRFILYVALFLFASTAANAQEFVPLYPEGKMPNSKGMKLKEEIREERIYQVGTPGFHAFLPPEKQNTGVAILVIPGGGYLRIAHIGARTSVANYFNSLGIAVFALDYRLPTSPDLVQKELGPLQDAQRALRLIRQNAERWKIDPQKIGVMGSSAGGHAASFIGTTTDEIVKLGDDSDKISAVPNFMILAAPVITMGEYAHAGSKKYLLGENPTKELIEKYSTERLVTAKTPAAFIYLATDDATVSPKNSLMFYSAMLDKKASATLHIYPSGGHAMSMKNGTGSASELAKLCELWLREIKMLPEIKK